MDGFFRLLADAVSYNILELGYGMVAGITYHAFEWSSIQRNSIYHDNPGKEAKGQLEKRSQLDYRHILAATGVVDLAQMLINDAINSINSAPTFNPFIGDAAFAAGFYLGRNQFHNDLKEKDPKELERILYSTDI